MEEKGMGPLKRGDPPRRVALGLKVLFGIVVVLLLGGIGFGAWFLRPIEEVPLQRLVPPGAFATFMVDFQSENPGFVELLARVKEKLLHSPASFGRKLFIRYAFPSVLPKRVVGIATAGEKTDLILIIEMGKKARLLQFFPALLDRYIFAGMPYSANWVEGYRVKITPRPVRRGMVSAYSLLGGSLVIASRPALLEDSFRKLKGDQQPPFPGWEDIVGVYIQNLKGHDLSFFVDNSGGDFTRWTQSLEERFSYALLPSANSISMLVGYFNLSEKDMGNGLLVFRCPDVEATKAVQSDLRFFYGAMRRVLIPRGMKIVGTIKPSKNIVKFAFQIENIQKIIPQP